MLSYSLMGVLGLAIVWVSALLVAGAAWKELGPIRGWSRAARAAVRGTVVRGAGPAGALAALRVEQVGRSTDGGELLFADKGHESEVFGGAVELSGGREVELAPVAAAPASTVDLGDGAVEVWLDDTALAAASGCPGSDRFDEAFAAGKKARGFARTVEATVEVGAEVFVIGELGADGASIGAARLVSTIDPAVWASQKTRLVLVFIALELAAAGVSTFVALWPPVFGLVSKLGGALCLGFFLGVQPIGTAVRDAVRSPARHALRGRWVRGSAGAAARVTAPS